MSNELTFKLNKRAPISADLLNKNVKVADLQTSAIQTVQNLYQSSAGTDFLSASNALKQAAYEAEEESIADMLRNFEVGRNWNYILGLADILKKDIPNKDKNDQYSRAVGFPAFSHLISYGQAVESAFMQGLSSSPMSLTAPELISYYANVIADREGGGAAIIQAFESGSEFLLTPVEKQAYDIARSWQQTVTQGGQLPAEASLPNEFESVAAKWDNKRGTVPATSTTTAAPTARRSPAARQSLDLTAPVKVPKVSQTVSTTKKTPQKVVATRKTNLPRVTKAPTRVSNLLGNILPSSKATVQSNTARIFALLGISYGIIQLVEYYRRRS